MEKTLDNKVMEQETLENSIQEKPWLHKIKNRKKELAIGGAVVVVIVLIFLIQLLGKYESYDAKESFERLDASGSSYEEFQGNLLKYSADGAFLTDYEGNLIWNETYEMTSPMIDICGDYILIYDKQGTQMTVLTATGVKGNIQTNVPITEANIADQGTVAALMQEGNSSYLQLYSLSGETLASGELHTENSGYPVAIALSSDAKKLMVSMINMNDGDVKTTIAFYNFGTAGKKKIDNLVASYSYSNLLIPEINFVEGNKAIAFGDNEIIIYGNGSKPKVEKEIFVDKEMKSIFYNDHYFGMVCAALQEDGSTTNEMSVYNMSGGKRFSKEITIPYNRIELMTNNEIMLTNGTETNIYTLQGIKKFAYTFETGIYKIIPEDNGRKYIFIEDGVTEKVRIK